jgi:tetratricopeptide (TPR) repeat protein
MAAEQKQSSAAGELEDLAISYSEQAKNISPKNLNVLKTRVRVFYLLSLLKPDYLAAAIDTLRESIELAPTDPKLVYNLGLLYAKMNNSPLAIQTIEKAIQLKPDYVDARNALELIYEETGDKQKAIEQLQILIKLAPENAKEFQKKLDQLK